MGLLDIKVNSLLQRDAAKGTSPGSEAQVALETMVCPRCGSKLHYRDVVNAGGAGLAISQDWGEIADIYGHSYSVRIKDFIRAQEDKAS